jgi:hypothetical protein
MNRFTALVAAVLSVLASVPVAAQPRGRSQANTPSTRERESADDGDGPEARAAALFKLDDVIDVAVRLSPDIARARVDREVARQSADAARKDQSWVLTASANYQADAVGADTPDHRLEPFQVLRDERVTGSLGLGRNLPTGGNLSAELGLSHQRRELNIPGEFLSQAEERASECGETIDISCQDQATAKLTLKQPLLRGLGTDVALGGARADGRRGDAARPRHRVLGAGVHLI